MVRVVHVVFGVGLLHDGITADPSCLFLYSFHAVWVKHSVCSCGSLVRRVVPCPNPNLQRSGNRAAS